MKVLIAVLMMAALVHGDWKPKTGDEIKNIRSECLQEHPLDPEVMTHVKKLEFPDTDAVHKYVSCVAEKMDVFNTRDGWQPERIIKQFDLNESDELDTVKGCTDRNEQRSPKDVWRVYTCMLESKVGDEIKEHIKWDQ